MVKTKKSSKSCPISKKPLKPSSKGFSSKCLILKAKKALSKNIQIGKFLLNQLKEFTWDVSNSQNLLVSLHMCPICAYNYNNSVKIPICLPCGHTICKSCVYSLHNSLLTGSCPFDRKEYFFIDDLLPVNYSLLNSCESQNSKICHIHGMVIIGYCKDHCELLCGKCIFTHKSHDFFELDSFQVGEIVSTKIIGIQNVENRLIGLLEIWEDYKNFILAAVDRMNKAINGQIFQQDEVVERVKGYIKNIVDDFEGSGGECSVNISQVINCLKIHLERVRAFKTRFEEMDVCEKLTFDTGKTLEFESPALLKITALISELEEHLQNSEINLNHIE